MRNMSGVTAAACGFAETLRFAAKILEAGRGGQLQPQVRRPRFEVQLCLPSAWVTLAKSLVF